MHHIRTKIIQKNKAMISLKNKHLITIFVIILIVTSQYI